jgi:hypothetical protein
VSVEWKVLEMVVLKDMMMVETMVESMVEKLEVEKVGKMVLGMVVL